jgi:small subunit ribosomal protein S20
MAITQSAKKAHRAAARKRVFNLRRMKKIDAVTREIKKLAAAKKQKEALALLSEMYQAFDKAAKAGTIKKGAANRKKSRMAVLIQKAK